MTPIYLTFSDEDEALTALMVHAGDEITPRWQAHELQWVSVQFSRPTGAVDADGAPIFAPVAGYHINALWDEVADIAALDSWRSYPDTPSVVWSA